MAGKLDPYLSEAEISDELFTTANGLVRRVLERMAQQRKVGGEDGVNL